MKNSNHGQVIGIPIRSITYPLDQNTSKKFHTNNLPDDRSSALRKSRVESMLSKMNKFGKKADNFTRGIKDHVKVGPKILGAKILRFGRVEKIFKQLFCVGEYEKLLKVSQCYLSTTAGPIAGLLFISTNKVAFCSQKSIKLSTTNGELFKARYKVVIPVSKIKRVNQSENVKKPSQKYIEIVTDDNFDFWFMGFLNYQKAFKYLQQSVSQS